MMSKEHLLSCLFAGGLQNDFITARNAYEIVNGMITDNDSMVIHLPPPLYDVLKILEGKDDVTVYGIKAIDSHWADIKFEKKPKPLETYPKS